MCVLGGLLFAVLAFEGGSALILMPCPSAPPLSSHEHNGLTLDFL